MTRFRQSREWGWGVAVIAMQLGRRKTSLSCWIWDAQMQLGQEDAFGKWCSILLTSCKCLALVHSAFAHHVCAFQPFCSCNVSLVEHFFFVQGFFVRYVLCIFAGIYIFIQKLFVLYVLRFVRVLYTNFIKLCSYPVSPIPAFCLSHACDYYAPGIFAGHECKVRLLLGFIC